MRDFGEIIAIVAAERKGGLLPLVAMGRGLALVGEATASIPFPGIVYCPVTGEMLISSAMWSAKNDNPALRRLLAMAIPTAGRGNQGAT